MKLITFKRGGSAAEEVGILKNGVEVLPIRDAALFTSAASDARILVKKAFDQNDITIPYQTITVSNQAEGHEIRVVTLEREKAEREE